ncbi:MAG TPA: DMT family transporter [Elusimicrobiota bacterium]|nr:DMT family transporter [Elusimicrobiota bacterium]
MSRPGPGVLAAWTFLLFLLWSNSFIAISALLGREGGAARFDWVSLTAARFLLCAAVCALYCALWRRRESVELLRLRWRRLLAAGLLCVPCYNFALYYGQQHGVPAPIASLETALAPLFLMLLGAAFLGEGLSRRKLAGFAVALAGVCLISRARAVPGQTAYPVLVAITALAPLSWASFSTLSKPVSREASPVVWTYLCIVAGSIPLAVLALVRGLPELARLDAPGWGALLFLAALCTVFGFALWTWLLKHLPASSLGFTIFLNPPLTSVSKALLAALFPRSFSFQVSGAELAGGGVVLAGLALALLKFPGRRAPRPA